jgi:hypothetical protein
MEVRDVMMRNAKWVLIIRSVIAALLLALGVGALAGGRVVGGVLLIGLATANVALTITMRRRRAELLQRFPRLAQARGTRGAAPAPE